MQSTKEQSNILFSKEHKLEHANSSWQFASERIPDSTEKLAVMLHIASRDSKLTTNDINTFLQKLDTNNKKWAEVSSHIANIEQTLFPKYPLNELDNLSLDTGSYKVTSTEDQQNLANRRNQSLIPIDQNNTRIKYDANLVISDRFSNDLAAGDSYPETRTRKLYETLNLNLIFTSTVVKKLLALNYMTRDNQSELEKYPQDFHLTEVSLIDINKAIVNVSSFLSEKGVVVRQEDILSWQSHYDSKIANQKI